MAARFVDQIRQSSRAVPEQLSQLFKGLCFLDGIQILPLDIFQKCDFQSFGIIEITNNRRNFMNLRPLRRPPAPFARDDLIGIVIWTHDNRLDNPVSADASGQFGKLILGKVTTRLSRIGMDIANCNGSDTLCTNIGGNARRLWRYLSPKRFPQQCIEPPP